MACPPKTILNAGGRLITVRDFLDHTAAAVGAGLSILPGTFWRRAAWALGLN
jgi:hypothetical protein